MKYQNNYFKQYFLLEPVDESVAWQGTTTGFMKLEFTGNRAVIQTKISNIKPYTNCQILLFKIETRELRGIVISDFMPEKTETIIEKTILVKDFSEGITGKFDFVVVIMEKKTGFEVVLYGAANKNCIFDDSLNKRVLDYYKTNFIKHNKERDEKKEESKIKEPINEAAKIKNTKDSEEAGLNQVQKTEESAVDKKKNSTASKSILEERLKKVFEPIDPFENQRSDYTWYKVSDLALLSNIMFESNIRLPIFANPKVLMGLFKFGFLIAGIYHDSRFVKRYFVLGVPGNYNESEKPFDSICKWVRITNSKSGVMTGYWLIYLELTKGDSITT